MKEILSLHYDLDEDVTINHRIVDLLAESKIAVRHYAISRKWVLDEARLYDRLTFLIESRPLTLERLDEYFAWLEGWAGQTIDAGSGHFRSRFVGVLFFERADLSGKPLAKIMKRYSRSRWLRWGLHGWQENLLLVCRLPDCNWYGSRKGKDFAAIFTALQSKLHRTEKIEEA